MTPPIAADLRPSVRRRFCSTHSSDCLAYAPGWPRRCAPSWPRQTANGSRHRITSLRRCFFTRIHRRCRLAAMADMDRKAAVIDETDRRRASGRTDTRLLHGWWTPAPLEASSVNKWKALSSVPCQWWCHWKLTELERECLLPLHKGFL